mgnify:CR=1 FL=1
MASLNESLYSSPAAKRALKMYEKRIQIAESVRKEAGKSAMTYEQKLATAMTLSNTARQLKVMESLSAGGATQPSSIGQYKRFAMDMVGTIMPSLIAPDLVSVQAIDNKVGMINVLEYQYGSDKGSAANGQVFASPLGYQGMNPYYTTASVDGEALKSGVETPQTLQYTPVKEGTLRIVDDTGAMLTETTDYTITGNDVKLTATGKEKTGLKAYYLYDNETVPVIAPQIKLDIKSIPIETKSRKLSAIWAFDAQYELSKEYGADMQQLLATQATAEIEQEIDNEITLDLYRIANAGPEVSWSRIQPVGVNIVDHYDSFWNKIVEGSNQIYSATRRARANFMVCGLGVDAVLKTMRNFVPSEDMTAVGPHFIGTLGGQIKCYVNPNYDANSFVLGYKGNTLMDAGYVYAPYMPVMTTGMVTLADDFAAREGWATTYGKKTINPRLYIKGRIDG